jgi:subtilisin family serine protease
LSSSVPHQGLDLTTDASFDGVGQAVAIIDTGVDSSHSTFGSRVVEEACYSLGADCPGGVTSLVGPGAGTNCSYSQDCFHGTHVAGIAAGASSTYTGAAPAADIVAVNVFTEFTGAPCNGGEDPCALAYTSDIIAGLAFARGLATVSVAAATLSLGGGQYTSQAACNAADPPMLAEITAVRAAGIAPVAASGNESYTNAMGSPACLTGAISVGSTSDSDVVASYSNSASFLSLLATGVNVTSSIPAALFGGTKWGTASGTSMATPHVAGSFAALRSALPAATVDQILTALQSTGVDVTDAKSGVTTPRIQVDLAGKSLAPAECWNGLDDDSEGDIDFPADPGCGTGRWVEDPECQDGLDNDGDGGIDYAGGPLGEPADAQCYSPSRLQERVTTYCGLGPELLVLLPLLAGLRRRRWAAREAI